MNKYQTLRNAKKYIQNITKKARSKFFDGQDTIHEKYNVIVSKLNNQTTIIQDLNAKALQPSVPLPKNIIKWWQWYYRLTGLDAVEVAKQQVIVLQNKLFKCQNNRSTMNKQSVDITHKLKEVYGELIQTKRDDPKYVHLTIMENKILQEHNKLNDQLLLLEKEEKDNFIQLSTAIKEYHDNQNMNAQKYKYLSLLVSAFIAIISFIVSMILNNHRILDVRNFLEKAEKNHESLFNKNENQLSNVFKILDSYENKLSQIITNTEKKTEISKNNNTSNILMTSATYTANAIILGGSYIKKGIYATGSYIKNIFYW